jgi:hypothetical protein
MAITNDNLPVIKENFLAEVEVMDLSKIKDNKFLVAVSTGKPDGIKFVPSTVHGPYEYLEMVQEVGVMWDKYQHHARVILLSKNADEKVVSLDENTLDYIECHYNDIIAEEMIGMFDKDFTCQAGTSVEEESTDPRHAKVEEALLE